MPMDGSSSRRVPPLAPKNLRATTPAPHAHADEADAECGERSRFGNGVRLPADGEGCGSPMSRDSRLAARDDNKIGGTGTGEERERGQIKTTRSQGGSATGSQESRSCASTVSGGTMISGE
jgi:hypothetical protein